MPRRVYPVRSVRTVGSAVFEEEVAVAVELNCSAAILTEQTTGESR